MSRQLALDTINLKPVPRLAHTEFSLMYHKELVKEVTGLDASHPDAYLKFSEAWELDFNWLTNEGLTDWAKAGRTTNMGHAVYAADGSDQTSPATTPFQKPEDVWEFDAVKEYGLPTREEQTNHYENMTKSARDRFPNMLTTGGYYRTIVSGAIASFGWDMFLLGLSEPGKMEPVLDSFFRRTLFHMECWAQTSAEVIIQHDDFVWTEGAFMHPDIYRKVIIPRYAELWKPLHKAGKKVVFCSDANYTEFAEDVAEAGADGFIFEPMMDFKWMVDRFGSSHCLIGSAVDCRDMTFGKWDKVKADIDLTFELSRKCKGLIFCVGNHLPANITDDMMKKFISYFREKNALYR